MPQGEFARIHGIDQGLLSNLLNGVLFSISMETALKLALAFEVAPQEVFQALDRNDWTELLTRCQDSKRKEVHDNGANGNRIEMD